MAAKSAILLLADGTSIQGTAFGKTGTTTGELCFNTGMTGYQEVFTDPSYYGQVLIMNSVHQLYKAQQCLLQMQAQGHS